jgi:hypothetical protein
MKRSDFISNRKIEIPKLDEKVIGPMVLQALLEADVNIDDTIENREILQKYIKKIVTAGMNLKEAIEDQNETTRRLMDVLRTTPGTSTGLFRTNDISSPLHNITYGGSGGSSGGGGAGGVTSTTSYGDMATSSTIGGSTTIALTGDPAEQDRQSYFAGIDPDTGLAHSIRSVLADRTSLSASAMASAFGIGNAAV